jgi:hypothetical protein
MIPYCTYTSEVLTFLNKRDLTMTVSLPRQKHKCPWCDASSTPDLTEWLLWRISGEHKASGSLDPKRWNLTVLYRFKRFLFMLRHFTHLFRKYKWLWSISNNSSHSHPLNWHDTSKKNKVVLFWMTEARILREAELCRHGPFGSKKTFSKDSTSCLCWDNAWEMICHSIHLPSRHLSSHFT